MNVLYISPDFNYSCGVSKHVYDLLIHYDSRVEFTVHFITNGGDALSKLEKHNIKYSLFRFTKGWRNIFCLPLNFSQLKSFCVEKKIDIIHTHHRYPELLSTLIAKRLNIKSITTAHSLVKGYKHLSFKSDKIIAVSNSVKNSIIRDFPGTAEKIVNLYNCIMPCDNSDLHQANKIKEELNLQGKDFVILFLGRINKIKGIDVLIEAFRKVRANYVNIKLVLLGSILDDTVDKMNIRPNEDIFVLPAKVEVGTYYELCDLIVLPSREDPFPYIMLEAGLYRKPFLGSRTGGIAEFIDDGVNGFLFELSNANDLANKIIFVINNPEKANSAAEELHKKVIKYCNCEEYFEKLTNIYNELLNE